MMFIIDGNWIGVRDGDPGAYQLFTRHYSFHEYRDNRRLFSKLFAGPGQKMVLVTQNYDALFVWRKFVDDSGQTGVNNAIFRNEGKTLSSVLIREAGELAWVRWPGERLYTYIDTKRIGSANPGYCYKVAGWQLVRDEHGKPLYTKSGKMILEKYPEVMR